MGKMRRPVQSMSDERGSTESETGGMKEWRSRGAEGGVKSGKVEVKDKDKVKVEVLVFVFCVVLYGRALFYKS